ncbi:hypothetical protein LIER_21318 [Lithospermum erythrorhizon]|uniref:Uncharacterized protein n=1 Tax=Lithospermum erythrorhizon TaxID=34254 RepID=A0AAV3QSU3_LITER
MSNEKLVIKASCEDKEEEDFTETMSLLAKNFNKILKRFNKKPYSGGNNPGSVKVLVTFKWNAPTMSKSSPKATTPLSDDESDEEEGSDNNVNNFVAFTARDTKEDVVISIVNDCPTDTMSDDEGDLTKEELMANYQMMFMKWSKLTRADTAGEIERDALMKKSHDLMKFVEQQKLEIRILEEKVHRMIKGIKMMNSSIATLDEILLQGNRSGDNTGV